MHIARLDSELCPINMLESYFSEANILTSCKKNIFRGLQKCKTKYKLREADKAISYTTVRENVLEVLGQIGLNINEQPAGAMDFCLYTQFRVRK